MTSSQELNVILFQAAAAVLMGVDYYLGTPFRERLEGVLKNYLQGVQTRADADITRSASLVAARRHFLYAAALMSIAFVGLMYTVAPTSEHVHPALGAFVALVALGLFAGALYAIQVALFEALAGFAVALPFRALTMWLLGSPKGPIASLGFLVLMWFFYARYSYVVGG